MKKKILSCLLVLAMLLSTIVALPISAGAVVTEDTTWVESAVENVYIIENEADLLAFSKALSSGNSFEGKTINLTTDITMTADAVSNGVTWYAASTDFKGTFDGFGHTISGIHFTTTGHTGIFGGGSRGGTVRNVSIVNSSITASAAVSVGSIFGRAMDQGPTLTTTISNVYADVDITVVKGENVGGLIGVRWGATDVNINSCIYAGTITVNGAGDGCGGIFGQAGAIADAAISITNSGFFGTITTTTGGAAWGKLVGKITDASNNVVIENCIAAGTLTTPKGADMGIGAVYGAKSKAASTVSVTNTLYTAVSVGTNEGLTGDTSVSWINEPTTNTNNTLKTAADLQGIDAQSILPAGWVASTSATGNPVPAALVGIAPVNTVATPVTTVKGYQATAKESEKFSIRLVGVINGTDDVTDLADYDAVGFRVVAHYNDDTNGLQIKTNVVTTATVYSALGATTASGYTTYNATELGGLIFALNCNNIPANSGVITFEVTPIIKAGNVETEGSTVTFTVDPADIPAADLTAA